MSLMAANEESDSSAILNGFWVTLINSQIVRITSRICNGILSYPSSMPQVLKKSSGGEPD